MKYTDTPSQSTVSTIMRDTRSSRQATLRAFAAELSVSFNSVLHWEDGSASPTYERIVEWIRDERRWVHELGASIARVKYAELFVLATATQPSRTTAKIGAAQ